MPSIRNFQDATPHLSEYVYVDPMATIIGQVSIAKDCSIWPYACIRADVNTIKIGARTNIQDHAVLHVTHAGKYNPKGFALTIGDDVTIGHRVVLHGCKLASRILIGINTVIMDGAVIDDDVMIGANTLVSPGKHLTSGFLYYGSPVKQVRALTEDEIEFLKYSACQYVKLKNAYIISSASKR